MAATQERLKVMVPVTLILIVILLFLALRGWGQTLIVLLSVPFAVVGSIWLLMAMRYNLSTAVWVGLIAVAGVATQTVIVVVVYLDQALRAAHEEGKLGTVDALQTAVVEGAVRGVRPMVMTVATTVLGLLPLLWESGVGADLSARTAAPVVGGMVACLFLTLFVIPAAYTIWRHHQLQGGKLPASVERSGAVAV
jgi:Cu(I)/Ag(I) efflux system membrane protein CusA/SilA